MVHQVLRHHRKLAAAACLDVPRLQPNLIARLVSYYYALGGIFRQNADYLALRPGVENPDVVLRSYAGAGVENGVEQRFLAELAADSRKIGAGGFLAFAELVARIALRSGAGHEHQASAPGITGFR